MAVCHFVGKLDVRGCCNDQLVHLAISIPSATTIASHFAFCTNSTFVPRPELSTYHSVRNSGGTLFFPLSVGGQNRTLPDNTNLFYFLSFTLKVKAGGHRVPAHIITTVAREKPQTQTIKGWLNLMHIFLSSFFLFLILFAIDCLCYCKSLSDEGAEPSSFFILSLRHL